MTTLAVTDLTQATLNGTGVFDVFMRANKAHLEAEFTKGRIKGAEYATVYLGSLESVMQNSMAFLIQRERVGLEAELLRQQVILAEVGVLKANAELAILNASLAKIPLELTQITAQTGLVNAQIANAQAELAIIQANALKVPAEIAHLQAQTLLVGQQKANLTAECLNISKQGTLLDSQDDLLAQQIDKETRNNFLHPTDIKLSGANDQQRQVLMGQKCKLDAEFDLLKSEVLKSGSEIALLTQKNATEKAQVMALGVDADSVIGRQKALYQGQTEGFKRDAEQKAAKITIDTWNVMKTTTPDETEQLIPYTTMRNVVDKMISKI